MPKLVYLNKLFLPTPIHIRTSRVLGSNKYIIFATFIMYTVKEQDIHMYLYIVMY